MRTAVVFAGGPHRRSDVDPSGGAAARRRRALDDLRPDLVVAVDSGLHLADALGFAVDRIVGDMDSVDPGRLAIAEQEGATVVRHPVDKDATDLELALDDLVAEQFERAVVVGVDGGRMDHLLGGALTLCSPRFAALRMQAWLGGALVVPVHDRAEIRGRRGQMVSLIPMGGPALGVRTRGLRWVLAGERLDPGSSRGLSNEMVAEAAEVSVEHGCIAVVVPEEERT